MSRKLKELGELRRIVAKSKREGKRVVFTNGCFDLLHRGHLHLLARAKKLGDLLIVAINGDMSIEKGKGPGRPIMQETERAELLAALEMVDYVIIFSEPDPGTVIGNLRPNVLVKGGDWTHDGVIGREIVEGDGGEVVIVPLLEGYSTTSIIERIHRA